MTYSCSAVTSAPQKRDLQEVLAPIDATAPSTPTGDPKASPTATILMPQLFRVEGQPWVPVGSTVGPRLLGRHPWVPAQESSTVGPRDQISLLRARGNQTKLSTFDTVVFRVRRRPDHFHARSCATPLHSPCQKFGNSKETLTIFAGYYFLQSPSQLITGLSPIVSSEPRIVALDGS